MRAATIPLLACLLAAQGSARREAGVAVAVGAVTPTSARMQVTTPGPALVTLRVGPAATTDLDALQPRSWTVETARGSLRIPLDELAPGTEHAYRLDVLPRALSGRRPPATVLRGRFRTAPAPAAAADQVVVFGSDLAGPGPGLAQRLIAEEPALFVSLAGFPDVRTTAGIDALRLAHERFRGEATVSSLLRAVAIAALWGPRDVVDGWHAGSENARVAAATTAWREAFPVAVPDTERRLYRVLHRGADLDLFLLDTFPYRDPADGPPGPRRTVLGAEQERWLRDALAASTASFRIVVSGLRWTGAGGWQDYPTARAAMRDLLRRHRVTALVTAATGAHGAVLHHADGLIELVAGPLGGGAEVGVPALHPAAGTVAVTRGPAFGLARVHRPGGVPRLVLELHDASGARHRDTRDLEPAVTLAVQQDDPRGTVTVRGPHDVEVAGDDRRQGLAAGVWHVAPGPVPGLPGTPAPLALRAPPGAAVTVATSWRELPDPALVGTRRFEDDGERAAGWRASAGLLRPPRRRAAAVPQPGSATPTERWTWSTAADGATAFDLAARLRIPEDGVVGLSWRRGPGDDGYHLELDVRARERRLLRTVDGVATVLASDRATLQPGAWYPVTVAVRGAAMTVSVAGRAAFDVTDATRASGPVGLLARTAGDAAFDDVVLRAGAGLATSPTVDRVEEFVAAPIGHTTSVETVAIGDDPEGRPPTAAWYPEAGTLVSDVGRRRAAAAGAGAALLLGAAPLDAVDEDGLADGRVTVVLRRETRSPLAIVFRWRGPTDHYRVEWGAGGRRARLVRWLGGERRELAERQAPLELDRWHRITCRAQGFVLAVDVDGTELFSVVDGGHVAGRVGVVADGPGVRIERIETGPIPRPRATVAVVQEPAAFTLHVAAPHQRGRVYQFLLAARRHPAMPLALLDPADRRVLRLAADDPLLALCLVPPPRGLGLGGQLDADGRAQHVVGLPPLATIHGSALHVGGWVLDPDGRSIAELLPTATVTLPGR